MNIRDFLSQIYTRYRYYRFVRKATFKIVDSHETIDNIVSHRYSVSRYGDGEFDVAFGVSKYFQKADTKFSTRLRAIANTKEDRHIVCLPLPLLTLRKFRISSREHWMSFVSL